MLPWKLFGNGWKEMGMLTRYSNMGMVYYEAANGMKDVDWKCEGLRFAQSLSKV